METQRTPHGFGVLVRILRTVPNLVREAHVAKGAKNRVYDTGAKTIFSCQTGGGGGGMKVHISTLPLGLPSATILGPVSLTFAIDQH